MLVTMNKLKHMVWHGPHAWWVIIQRITFMQTLFSESNEIKLVLVTRIMGNNAWNISKTLFVCLSQSPPFWLQYILICSKFRRKWEMLWVFVYTNTHPGKEKAVTTGILYYIRICNPWPNMNTLCKFCELLQKKNFFFFGGIFFLLRPQTWPILWSPHLHPQFLFPPEIIRKQ